jgi:hypothetical protein
MTDNISPAPEMLEEVKLQTSLAMRRPVAQAAATPADHPQRTNGFRGGRISTSSTRTSTQTTSSTTRMG